MPPDPPSSSVVPPTCQTKKTPLPACTKNSSSDAAASTSASEAAVSLNATVPSASTASPVPPPSTCAAPKPLAQLPSDLNVLTPYHRTMLHKRKIHLVILAHEKSITSNLDMDEFVRVFAKGNRRLV